MSDSTCIFDWPVSSANSSWLFQKNKLSKPYSDTSKVTRSMSRCFCQGGDFPHFRSLLVTMGLVPMMPSSEHSDILASPAHSIKV